MPSRNKPKLSDQEKAFMEACWAGRRTEVASLVRAGVNLNLQDIHVLPFAQEKPFQDSRLTGLMYATLRGHADIVKFLITKGADVSVESNLRNTALGFAASLGRTETVELLLSRGADPNDVLTIIAPCSILTLACAAGHLETVKVLIEYGADVKPGRFGYPLCSAIRAGHLKIVRELLNAGANPNPRDGKPLTEAAALGRQEVVRLLLKSGANVECFGGFGWNLIKGTPLMWAARHGHTGTVNILLAAKANLETLSKDLAGAEDRHTALGLAEKQGHGEVARILRKAGATLTKEAKGYKVRVCKGGVWQTE